MSNHDEYELLMSAALDEELSLADQDRLREHVHNCPRCAATWKALAELDLALSHAAMVGPAPGLSRRVQARLREDRTARLHRRRIGLGVVALWATALGSIWSAAAALALWAQSNPEIIAGLLGRVSSLLGGLATVLRAGWALGAGVDEEVVLLVAAGCLCVLFCATGLWILLMTRNAPWFQRVSLTLRPATTGDQGGGL